MTFQNTLLEQIVEMPDLSGHWLYNFNTLRDKNETVTETNKIGSTQITAQNALKRISLGEHSKRNNLEGRYFKSSSKTKKLTLQTFF